MLCVDSNLITVLFVDCLCTHQLDLLTEIFNAGFLSAIDKNSQNIGTDEYVNVQIDFLPSEQFPNDSFPLFLWSFMKISHMYRNRYILGQRRRKKIIRTFFGKKDKVNLAVQTFFKEPYQI